MITLNLTPDQIGLATIALSAAQLAAIHAQESAPVLTPPPPSTVPLFVAPPEYASRAQMHTEAKWEKAGSFYSASPLTDANVWIIGFTPTNGDAAGIATAEFQGDHTDRNWKLIRNRDGAVLAESGARPVQGPGCPFNGTSTMLTKRIPLEVGARYSFVIANAVPGISSRMVGQLYF